MHPQMAADMSVSYTHLHPVRVQRRLLGKGLLLPNHLSRQVGRRGFVPEGRRFQGRAVALRRRRDKSPSSNLSAQVIRQEQPLSEKAALNPDLSLIHI